MWRIAFPRRPYLFSRKSAVLGRARHSHHRVKPSCGNSVHVNNNQVRRNAVGHSHQRAEAGFSSCWNVEMGVLHAGTLDSVAARVVRAAIENMAGYFVG